MRNLSISQKIIIWTLGIILVSTVVYGIVVQFQNPELTRTQLFLEYWYVSIISVASGLPLQYLINKWS
jgi:uncharacterized membrane protein